MEKWIYKITNKINGKVYIGQSKNPIRRFQEHIKSHTDSAIHQAIIKYGEENFDFQIIEGPIVNYNEREQYWINYYDSYNKGYNKTLGGENPPITSGQDSAFAKYSNELVLKLQLDLINTGLSYQELSRKYEINENYISLINRGLIRHNDIFNYPLRDNKNYVKTIDILDKIAEELSITTKSVEQIAKENNVDSSLVYKLNLGKHKNSPQNFQYPIRPSGRRISYKMLSDIIYDLLDNKLKLQDIENKYNLSKATINRINQGKSYRQKGLKYPLRPSNKRVYN